MNTATRRSTFWGLPIAVCWLIALFDQPATLFAKDKPLALHPKNPHYFLWRGKPTLLITSGEHYGAVLNLDFDYRKYLDTLAKDGLNLTRTFSGAYVEPTGSFNITSNTLAPAQGRFICPWARSGIPGYPNGGNKFDLTKWDEAYFRRLRDFVAYAAQRGVVVEMNLFCPFYDEAQWKLTGASGAAQSRHQRTRRDAGRRQVEDQCRAARSKRHFVRELP